MKALAIVVAVGLLWCFFFLVNRSGAGPASRPVSPSSKQGEASPLTDPPGSVHDETGASLSVQPAAGQPAETFSPEFSSSPPSAVSLAAYDWGTDAEAIAWLTLDAWEQPAVLELTQDEGHELLALDDTMGLKGPSLLTSIAGPLPTLEDCEAGARSERVKPLLQAALGWNAFVIELGGIPMNARSATTQGAIEQAVRAKDDADLALMEALDRETAFHAWVLWYRLYVRLSR